MSISPKDFYDMTMLEYWACFDVYCKKNGIKTDDAPDPDRLKDLVHKYGARSGSIKGLKHGKA